ncbi:ABC transporter ATP-binding protein [Microbacterium sp. A588]
MSDVLIEKLVKRYGGNDSPAVVNALDLHVREGELLVLLGPSGCGKTTTLRCIAGLEEPSSGAIEFEGRPLFDRSAGIDIPPERRRIGMVFQSYALWPHLTVGGNIGYPLKMQKVPRQQAKQQIQDTAALVGCEHLLDRYPAQLSGGQQQRIALARALVAQPRLILFDEPLSNLDARLRDRVRSEIHQLHSRLGFTGVFVTHDQSEAFALADRIAIMREGRIEQIDDPQVVFSSPASEYVAEFIGMSNRLELEGTEAGWMVGGTRFELPVGIDPPRDSVLVCRMWPEGLRFVPPDSPSRYGEAIVAGSVAEVGFGGHHYDVVVQVGATQLQIRTPAGGIIPTPGDAVMVGIDHASARYFVGDEPIAIPVHA